MADIIFIKHGANPIYKINFCYQITIENVIRIILLIIGKSWYLADSYPKIRIDLDLLTVEKSLLDKITKVNRCNRLTL
jgi:hypothetical protein